MKKWIAALAAISLTFVAPTAARADDAVVQPGVSVGSFPQYIVEKGKKAVVEPEAAGQGGATVQTARMTVKRGSKTVARNVTRVKLGVGAYQVTTTVKWSAPGLTALQTTVATKPLRITTLNVARESAAAFTRAVAVRAGSPVIADAIAAGADPSIRSLKRSAELDRIATAWAKKDAKTGKAAPRDWSKLGRYDFASSDGGTLWSPYYPSMGDEIGAWLAYPDGPLLQCGGRWEGEAMVSDCGAVEPWSTIGFGFAWGKKSHVSIVMILASDRQ